MLKFAIFTKFTSEIGLRILPWKKVVFFPGIITVHCENKVKKSIFNFHLTDLHLWTIFVAFKLLGSFFANDQCYFYQISETLPYGPFTLKQRHNSFSHIYHPSVQAPSKSRTWHHQFPQVPTNPPWDPLVFLSRPVPRNWEWTLGTTSEYSIVFLAIKNSNINSNIVCQI